MVLFGKLGSYEIFSFREYSLIIFLFFCLFVFVFWGERDAFNIVKISHFVKIESTWCLYLQIFKMVWIVLNLWTIIKGSVDSFSHPYTSNLLQTSAYVQVVEWCLSSLYMVKWLFLEIVSRVQFFTWNVKPHTSYISR